jgi:hypothetical protein
MQAVMQIGPLIGGAVLLLICGLNIVRNPQIANSNATLLALGALLFAVPTFANFDFSALGIHFSAQKIGDQLNLQGADIKLQLSDIKQAIAAIAKQANVSAPTVAPRTSSAPAILVFYVEDQQNLASQVQNYLLINGYAANATVTDFSEVKEGARGQPGTARIIYTSGAQTVAQTVLAKLKQQFTQISWDSAQNNSLSAANMEIKIF